MPANWHLQWFDINDFTPGLWEAQAAYNRFAAPANSFRTLTDYRPVQGGGLKAMFKPTALDLTGIGAGERPMGIFVRSGAIRTGAGGTGNQSSDIVLVTLKQSDNTFKIYRRDGTVASPAWSLRFTSAAASDNFRAPVDFAFFKDTSNVEWYLMSIWVNGAVRGLYKMQVDLTVASNTGSDGAVTKINAFCGPMVISQARIIVGEGATSSDDDTLKYGDVGLTTFAGAGSIDIAPNRGGSGISGISGIEPSDLLVAKEGAPWVTISGDITSATTPVREMGDDFHSMTDKSPLIKVPGGVAFIETGGRVVFTDGRNFKPISNQVLRHADTWTGNMRAPGTMAYINGMLFVPGNNTATNGYIYDFLTDSWFNTSYLNPVFSWADPKTDRKSVV